MVFDLNENNNGNKKVENQAKYLDFCKKEDTEWKTPDAGCKQFFDKLISGEISKKEFFNKISVQRSLYVSNECDFCNAAKSLLKDEIDKGNIKVIDVDNESETKQFLTNVFGGVPSLLVEEGPHVCEVDINTGDLVKCIDFRDD